MSLMNDVHLLVRISKMYYIEKMTQAEIADQIGVSRPAVSSLLSKAMNSGIVEIKIKDPTANDDKLSRVFKERFSLKNCRVIPTSVNNEKLLLSIVAAQGAVIAREVIENNTTLGIAWGRSCYEFMQAFEPTTNTFNIEVAPLIGGSNLVGIEFQLNEMVRIFAEKLNGKPYFIYAPAVVDTLEDKQLYMKSAYMDTIYEKWSQLDVAIITAGRDPQYSMHSYSARILHEILKDINNDRNRPVGDMCALHFNICGEFVNETYNERIIGVGAENLKKANHVICFASGKSRLFSIIGALNTGIINTLLIDDETANAVIDMLDSKEIICLR